MKTKPFDLQKALAGHQVLEKSGRRVIMLAHFPESPSISCRLQVLTEGESYPLNYYEDGRYCCRHHSEFDLLLEVKTVKRWARMIMNNGAPEVWELNFHSKESAEFQPGHTFLPAYEYEVEE